LDATHFVRAGLQLSEITDTLVVRSKAIVGINAFAHEAGIHQHGMMADPSTYEIMRP
jgi:2-isopropylmalate synthase